MASAKPSIEGKFGPDWVPGLFSLFTLITLVVAQSVYEVLAANQDFLALRQVSNRLLFEVIVAFNWLPTLLCFLLWLLFRRLHPGLARGFLLLVYFLLFLAFFLQLHNTHLREWEPFPYAYWFWILPAALLGLAALRFERPFRSFVLVLSPIVLLFPGLFLLRTWADRDSLSEATAPTQAIAAPEERKNAPPIFLLVLDELALPALLDGAGQIDGSRFPHFQELSAQSHWFRNTTANADHTTRSIPALLTGGFPLGGAPSHAYYPDNLLTLLEPSYDVYVYESITRFCLPERFHCLSVTRQGAASRLAFLRDVFYLYAARVVPPEVNIGLPHLRRTWGPFRDPRGLIRARLGRFEKFMDTVATLPKTEDIFFFFHHMLPHSPYVLTAEGRILDVSPHEFRPSFRGNTSLLNEVLERYRTQIMYVDKQLGRFVAQLKQAGLYEKSLLIVTADHGVSYRPQAPGRALKEVGGAVLNAEQILTVPLFIKLPFQSKGAVSERDVQLIDLVPTVANLLELEVPWPHTGRNVFASEVEDRPKVAYDESNNRFEFPPDLGLAGMPVQFDTPP